MSKKIPCGGFELGKSLVVDKDGKLDLAPGAGGVQSDWNVNDPDAAGYIKNRPFYEDEEVICNSIIAQVTSDSRIQVPSIGYEIGKEYIVTINGVRYITTMRKVYNPTASAIYVYCLGSAPWNIVANMPFSLYTSAWRNNGIIDLNILVHESIQDPVSVSISICNEIKQLNQKFIPSQRFDVTISQDDDGNLVSDKTPAEIMEAYNNGQIVNGNDDSFGFTLSFILANSTLAAFSVLNADGAIIFYMVNNDKTVDNVFFPLLQPADSLSNGLILTTSNGNWIPSNSLILPSTNFVLPSSTSGSTKKFLITVDDSGTISATEYTT